MDKRRLINQVKLLLTKNKTEDALRLLSKAQLSENDKNVIILMGQMSSLQQDSIINKISSEEKHRRQSAINKAILDLSENIDPEEISTDKLDLAPEKFGLVSKSSSSMKKTIADSSAELEMKNKKRPLWLLLLLFPLIYLVFQFRITPKPDVRLDTENGAREISNYLDDPRTIWNLSQVVYEEDFSDRHAGDFRGDIWGLVPNNADYWMGVKNDDVYVIELKGDRIKTRHKYLGNIDYNTQDDLVICKAKISLEENSKCSKPKDCLGRGITIDYNKSTRSAYTLTINDDGVIIFAYLKDFSRPVDRQVLYEQSVLKNDTQTIQLGLASYLENYFLYIDGELIKRLSRKGNKGTYCGVLAAGRGVHAFDEITIQRVKGK